MGGPVFKGTGICLLGIVFYDPATLRPLARCLLSEYQSATALTRAGIDVEARTKDDIRRSVSRWPILKRRKKASLDLTVYVACVLVER